MFKELFGPSIDFLLFILPIALPVILVIVLFKIWIAYNREKFIFGQDYVVLKIIPPREVFKTPLAMELFINALYQTAGEGTPIDRFIHGKVRAWFSLEIVSLEGKVGLYIWTRKSLASYLKGQLYAQYPGIEVKESPDYTNLVDYHSGEYAMFGIEYQLTEPDPLPIKTYVDYGLDQTASKEEQKVDPMTATLEFLGSLKQGEYGWIQIIVRAHKKEDKDPGKIFGKTDLWKDQAKKIITDLKKEAVYKDEKTGSSINLSTIGLEQKILSIERSVSKLPFDVGIRGLYIAKKDAFEGVNIGGLIGSFKQYSSGGLNGFKPLVTTSFDYWWQDISGKKLKFIKDLMFKSYVERDYFWGYKRKKMILNSEELATIFHIPGQVADSPSLERVVSRKSEAPNDLPI